MMAVDVRIVCATHQNLPALIKAGRFREDLYYRLAEIVVEVPPLRERQGDAVLLAHAFLRRASEQQCNALRFTDDAMLAIDDAQGLDLRDVREAAECAAVIRAVARADEHCPAAEMPAVSRPTLYDLINRLGIRTDV